MQINSELQNLEQRLGSWNVGSFCGKGTEVYEQLKERILDVCCLQEVRWRGQEAQFVGIKCRSYKLWWSGNNNGIGGSGISVKEELCKKVVEVHRRCDRVMSRMLVFKEEVMRVICAYGL